MPIQRNLGHDDDDYDESDLELLKWRARWYTNRSLSCLTLQNPIRRKACDIVEWKWFDRLIMVVIAANCVSMATQDPNNVDSDSYSNVMHYKFSIFFWCVFVTEACIKITAFGFILGRGTYLRDGWNCLDFFIVMTGAFEFLPATAAGSQSVILRTFRLLRPLRALRAIGRFKELRMLVELLIGCIPMLANVFGLIGFIIFIFGILGIQLWGGILRGHCYDIDTGLADPDEANICSNGSGMVVCPANEHCLQIYSNPRFGMLSFDTIGNTMFVIFHVMVQQNWTTHMYWTWDSFSFWTWIYFVTLDLVGPMFAIQLFLVVVASKYADAKAAQVEVRIIACILG